MKKKLIAAAQAALTDRIEEDDLYRVKEAATRWNVKEKTVRNWYALGRVRVVRLSTRSLRIPLSEINRIIAEGKSGEER